jgi:hypothetical protein
MHGYRGDTLTIHTTPDELREIADKMERVWPTLRAGDSTIVAVRTIDKMEVRFGIDQMKMEQKGQTCCKKYSKINI